MKTRKPTEPKNPEAVAETAPTIEIRKWGLVKKSREVFRVTEITGEMILDIAQRASKEARLQRLQIRVQEHASSELHEHHTEELDRIESHFAKGTEAAVLKLMLSNLELKLD